MTETTNHAVAELDANHRLWLEAAREAKAQVEHWQAICDRALEQVKTFVGEAEDVMVDGCLVARYSYVDSSRVDTKKLEAEHPELVEQYRKPNNYRRFTFTGTT